MGETSIEWTKRPGTVGRTWNPTRGCVKVSPGCKHCYAETFAERWRGIVGHPYERGFDPRLVPEKLFEPLRWRKPATVFVNSMSDLFADFVPFEYIAAVFGVMAATPQHTYLILTKRAERMVGFFTWAAAQDNGARVEVVWQALAHERDTVGDGGPMHTKHCASPEGPWPLPNVWLGVSAENQKLADERVPRLLQAPAAVRFVSAEPLLGSVDLTAYLQGYTSLRPERLDWVIGGGESGPGARPCATEWLERLHEQCRAAGVPFFCKQLGAVVVSEERTMPLELMCETWGRKPHEYAGHVAPNGEVWAWTAGLKNRKGSDPSEWPEDLRVREFPTDKGWG